MDTSSFVQVTLSHVKAIPMSIKAPGSQCTSDFVPI